jgi:hypothetical protein
MVRKYAKIAAALGMGALAGCVDRRFVVTTNVPGAQVFWDGKPLGPSPVDSEFEYAGNYEFTALAPGYEPLREKVRFAPKWYMYPPFDLIAETLYPGRIEDVRRVTLNLVPKRQLTDEQLLAQANVLRAQGKALPPPRFPDKKDAPPPARPGPPPIVSPGPITPESPPLAPGLPPSLQIAPPSRLESPLTAPLPNNPPPPSPLSPTGPVTPGDFPVK